MLSYLVIGFASAAVSALTLVSGFGLGTFLMPVFALFFPVEAAVSATAIVHGANSAMKALLVGRQADRGIVLHFGLPAIFSALAGAWLLAYTAERGEIVRYTIAGHQAVITPVKLLMAGLIFCFAVVELIPRLRSVRFDRRYLIPGGLLSGFFGGLSGHQGALRAAFLTKAGVSPEAFIGTNAVIALLVDITRLAVYGAALFDAGQSRTPVPWTLVLTGVCAAFTGLILGRRCIRKITVPALQRLVGVLLLTIALGLATGLLH